MSFWDSSAIVPLCVNELLSQNARLNWRRFSEHFVWTECPVEISSAIARRCREGSIDAVEMSKAEARLRVIETKWATVESENRLTELARTFPTIYGLKSLDSPQLAAALIWCRELPKNKSFVSAGSRLLKAAEGVGFTVHDLS